MTRFTLLFLTACSGAAPAPTGPHVNAALSLAADARMIVIPDGHFIVGSTPEERAAAYDDYRATSGNDTARQRTWFDGEDDRHPIPVFPAYRIDFMPVTQAAYGEFVAAGGAPAPAIDEAAWKAQHLAQDYTKDVARFVWHDGRPPAGREDHPVVLVTWDEASRYCQWRGDQRGEARHLPSAEQYEKASRGDNGLSYPWGNTFEADKLDSAAGGPHDTVAVGSFPAGASPYGVLDLAGNVFEWTATPFAAGVMTVKGSAWDDYGGVGRGASRHGRPRGLRHVLVGFRCAADGAGA